MRTVTPGSGPSRRVCLICAPPAARPPGAPAAHPPGHGPPLCRHGQLRRPRVGPPESPAPHRMRGLCGARHCPPAGGGHSVRRRMAGRPAVPRVRRAPLSGGGGLVTLVYARLLKGSQVREQAQEQSLSVRIKPTRGAVLAALKLHLPPALPAARRRAVISSTSTFLHTAGASVKIVAGDLNRALKPVRAAASTTGPERTM